jgi:hypothetical protein
VRNTSTISYIRSKGSPPRYKVRASHHGLMGREPSRRAQSTAMAYEQIHRVCSRINKPSQSRKMPETRNNPKLRVKRQHCNVLITMCQHPSITNRYRNYRRPYMTQTCSSSSSSSSSVFSRAGLENSYQP